MCVLGIKSFLSSSHF
uniref:Uncharacterized protein n=1 Tax=Rhizophora mucronata TaxID=61149 RepID=A0A2P2QZE4_RHIMU